MNKLFSWLKNTGKNIVSGIRRFPVTIGAAAAILALALILIHNDALLTSTEKDWLTRVCLTLGLALPLSVALQLLLERSATGKTVLRLISWAGLSALLTLYLLFLLPNPYTNNPVAGFRYLALLMAAVALVLVTAYFPSKPGNERFALKLLLRLLATALFTGILIGGLSLVLFMIEKLLGVKLWDYAYLDVAVSCACLFSPSFLLAGVPKTISNFQDEHYPPLPRVLFGYIAYPLLSAYTAIIYVYFLQILLKWNWPSNMLVNMVLWYTAIGVIVVYFMRSQSDANKWFRLFDAWYPRLTVLPIILMFTGLFIRIGEYGFTEARVFVLVLAIWVTAATAFTVLLRPEKRWTSALPALFAALAVLSVLGPWSAFAVSFASQNARLESLLAKDGMLSSSGKVISKQDIPTGDKQQIYEILNYFDSRNELGKVRVLPAETKSENLARVLGFDQSGLPDTRNSDEYISPGEQVSTLDVAGYDYVWIYNGANTSQELPGGATISVDDQSVVHLLKGGKVLYSKDLKEYVKGLQGSYSPSKQYSLDELTFTDETASVKVKFIIDEADISIYGETPSYHASHFYAIVKLK